MSFHSLLAFSSLVIISSLFLPILVHSDCGRNPVIFNFGDSNSDTGGFAAAHGLIFGFPLGRNFFNGVTYRLCDGRLLIDFLCESLKTPYLAPYLETVRDNNVANGANFAVSGSATLPSSNLFNLAVQAFQFIRFQNRSIASNTRGIPYSLSVKDFNNALYTFDIGQNDLAGSFSYLSYTQVIQKIPSFIDEIKNTLWMIYSHGGRNFWIHNTGPLGCLPEQLVSNRANSRDYDKFGCLSPHNKAANVFNNQLNDLCKQLRSQMKDAKIVYVDIYTIKYDLIASSSIYGFEKPLMACCGNGGPPYNFNPNKRCGSTSGYDVCKMGSKFVSWDGTHHTEFANSIVANKVLSGNYSTPNLKIDFFCK
ncbi:GDSL esterase/lipase At1g09390-like [Impatiens glandulifera]|uniref:GDSL esterase/lipase At1g09390-like n=1 Tax=Impatiens glandulifera TaxID=253017 RepID=UPI001FB0FD2D|nr:GDSL esterase/lipase At1g09390-like [Impatiens glandulifera]